MSGKSQLVSFRLSDDLHRRLGLLASSEGKSAGELARELVFARLAQDDLEADDLTALRRELAAFRDDFATAIEGLMTVPLRKEPLTLAQIKKFVAERLRHQPRSGEPAKEA